MSLCSKLTISGSSIFARILRYFDQIIVGIACGVWCMICYTVKNVVERDRAGEFLHLLPLSGGEVRY